MLIPPGEVERIVRRLFTCPTRTCSCATARRAAIEAVTEAVTAATAAHEKVVAENAHALAAASAMLREARTWLHVLADDQELTEPPSAYTDLLRRIDAALAK